MIKALITRDAGCSRYTVDIEGHAEYAEEGKDIVCAGVSALAMAAVKTLSTLEEAGMCRVTACDTPHPGSLHLETEVDEGAQKVSIMTVISMLAHGLEGIAQQHPDNIQLAIDAPQG